MKQLITTISKEDMNKYRLCYVDDNIAYFTDDMEKQWGDDWDDAPYEYNAGEPYTHETNVITIAFKCYDISLPCGMYSNSPWSIRAINTGAVAWIAHDKVCIHGGDTINQFVEKMFKMGGEVYLPVKIEE